MNAVLDGLMNGLNMGMQFRREKMQQEFHQRQMARLDREDEMRDIDFSVRMNQAGARQVDGSGLVSEPLSDNTAIQHSKLGEQLKFMDLGMGIRKAASGQTVRRKNRDGSTSSYELPTLEQQQARAHKDYAHRQEADENARLNRDTTLYKRRKQIDAEDLNQNGIQLTPEMAKLLNADPSRKFMPSQLDELARSAALMGNMQSRREQGDEVLGFHDFTDDHGNVITETRFKSGRTDQVKKGRIGKSKSSGRSGAAGGSGDDGDGLTAGQREAKQRYEQRRNDKAQEHVDRIQKEENDLHAEKVQLGESLNTTFKNDAKKGNDAQQRKVIEAKYAGVEFKIKAKQEAKKRIIEQHGGGEQSIMKQRGATANDPFGVR